MNNNALIAMDKSGSFRVYLAITTEMVEEARKNDIKIIPLCSFAKREFKLKKEYLDVLLKEEAVMGIIKSLENRRTYYNIDKNLPVLEKEIEDKGSYRISAGCIQYEKCKNRACIW